MAAAFKRATAALATAPPLSSTVERVLQRCGPRADLLLETVVNCQMSLEPFEMFSVALLGGQLMSQESVLMGRLLATALQQGAASCARCSPLGRLLIQSVSQSGSLMEGFMPFVTRGGVTTTSSDIDVMLHLGPVLWKETDAVCGVFQEAGAGSGAAHSPTGADSGQQDDQTVPRLRVVLTENPGFVLLYQVKQEHCPHPDEHLFSGDLVRQLIQRFSQVKFGQSHDVIGSGPAASFEEQRFTLVSFGGFDMVPCLRADWWPSDEFFQRSRARDWPPAAARADIRQFGIHLVPVGAKCSSTELHQWRLSFSRAEVVATWYLLPPQRNSLVALKFCKTALGPEGKPVKSYYMKTALFWLCQDSDVKQWTSIKQGVHMIVDFLERAIDAQYLGCFFCSEINLFGQSSPAELAEMRHCLSLLRRHMTRLLAHQLSGYIEIALAPSILRQPFQQLTERQLRVCLTRQLVIGAVMHSGFGFSTIYNAYKTLLIKMYLRSSAATELAVVLHNYHQQNYLFLALTVAPADVMARCRLTPLDDVMFSWDAAPLVELLTPEDLQLILGEPAAVHAWLKDQHRLPTGLSSSRARTDLLLNPSLLAEALRESVPWKWATMQLMFREVEVPKGPTRSVSFDEAKRRELKMWHSSKTLAVFERLPHHGTQSALRQYRQLREKARQFLDDRQTRAEYDQLARRLPDPWLLRRFVFTDSQ